MSVPPSTTGEALGIYQSIEKMQCFPDEPNYSQDVLGKIEFELCTECLCLLNLFSNLKYFSLKQAYFSVYYEVQMIFPDLPQDSPSGNQGQPLL